MKRFLPALLLLSLVAACGREPAAPRAPARVIVLGLDGLDPRDLWRLMQAGRLPHFRRLAEEGTFRPLATTMPPQSPVAWATFVTGMNPGGHGLFDFLRHDRRTFAIAEASARAVPPRRILGIPFGGGMQNLRHGVPFWHYLEERGIPVTIFRVPSNFPPEGKTARTFSGMGTPDLRGTPGVFTLYTEEVPPNAGAITGGDVVAVSPVEGRVETVLTGPPNPFRRGGQPVRIPLHLYLDRDRRGLQIQVGSHRLLLLPGEWSPWVRVRFPLWPPFVSVSGIVRFYLQRLRPSLSLYASPVNVDPLAPAFPISTPPEAVVEQAHACGLFHTKGMPAATKALQWGVFTEEEFVRQCRLVVAERERLLDYELARFRGRRGLLFFYFSTTDLLSHMLWRAFDARHPGHRPVSAAVARARDDLYVEMDRILGKVLREVTPDTWLFVMSDHGFAPYYRQVHLNTWLWENGFLAVFDPERLTEASLQEGVDWSRTRAYAVGFNGIFLNLFGRESHGQVGPRAREAVLVELTRKLLAWRDPATGAPVVRRVYRREEIYSGPYVAEAPDLLIGYARGYRGSNATALGEFGRTSLEDNREAWSGDHMMDPAEVPGVLLVNRRLAVRKPRLEDLPVTLLALFGVRKPAAMVGRNLLEEKD